MFNGLFTAQGIVTLLLGLAAFAAEVFALVDCCGTARTPSSPRASAPSSSGRSSPALAALLGFVSVGNSLLFSIGLIAVVGAGIYLADVRPALRQVSGGGRNGQHMGPYGPW